MRADVNGRFTEEIRPSVSGGFADIQPLEGVRLGINSIESALHGIVPILRFHDLRHEVALRKVEAGYPMHAVSLWLGHTNLTTKAPYLNADVAQLHALNDRPGPLALSTPS